MERPYQCTTCSRIFYAEADRSDSPNCTGDYGARQIDQDGLCGEIPDHEPCTGTGVFAGMGIPELYGDTTSLRLNEEHNWERSGMYNPHAVPMRDTPMYDRFVREGRIVMHEGKPCLRTRNRGEYNRTLKELGYTNGVGDGEMSKSRQADQRDHRCQE